MTSRYAIPSAANTVLVVAVAASMLLALSSPSPLAIVAYAVLFQTCFALFHEAAHHKLHARRDVNDVLGAVCGTLFGMSTTMFAITHWAHHLKNRADEEAYDQVAPGESYVKKAVGWYGMLLSLWYWVIPFSNVVILVAPSLAGRVARRVKIADRVFDAGAAVLLRVRIELFVWAAFVVVVAAVAGPRALLLQAAAAWLWSSTNYVEHAFAPRDVHRGAFNLRAPIYGVMNLRRELDRTHHRWPSVSWIHLATLTAKADRTDGNLYAHWLRQWRGPVRVSTPGPAPVVHVDDEPLP